MKTASKFILGLCLLTVSAAAASAKEWRGIVPLRSTRDDVTRVLGPSPNANNVRAEYSLEDEDVYIVFASRESYVDDCVKRLPLGTVLQIKVTPKKGLRLADLGLDESRLKKLSRPDHSSPGNEVFVDEEEGVVVRAQEGMVSQVVYLAAAEDWRLCPNYYEKPQKFVGFIADPCPNLLINCPTSKPKAGARVTFTVSLSGMAPALKPTSKWTVSAGAIVAGQGTATITVDTRALAGKTINATVEVGGFDRSCRYKESCEVQVVGVKRSARRVRGRR
jgi:hypothetical protein